MTDKKKFLFFFFTGLALLVCWDVSAAEKVKKSEIERDDLKKYIEITKILGEAQKDFIKEGLRQEAIAFCFRELIGEFEERYASKQIQDCIQLISMTDKQYGHNGLDASLILAWVEKASQGNPEAVSRAGAKGLTQWMDYNAWKILTAMGYSGYDEELIFNPVINLAGGLYYLNGLMNFWEWKGVKNRDRILYYTLCSYKYGSENTEELYNTDKKEDRPHSQYANWILKRRKYWVGRLKYWIENAHELTEKREERKSIVIDC